MLCEPPPRCAYRSDLIADQRRDLMAARLAVSVVNHAPACRPNFLVPDEREQVLSRRGSHGCILSGAGECTTRLRVWAGPAL